MKHPPGESLIRGPRFSLTKRLFNPEIAACQGIASKERYLQITLLPLGPKKVLTAERNGMLLHSGLSFW